MNIEKILIILSETNFSGDKLFGKPRVYDIMSSLNAYGIVILWLVWYTFISKAFSLTNTVKPGINEGLDSELPLN